MKPLFFAISIFSFLAANAQHIKYIDLKDEMITYAPKFFFINDVADDRENKGTIGTIDGADIDLRNGAADNFKTFIDKNVNQKRSAQPVILHITKLNCELTWKDNQWQLSVDLGFAYYLNDKSLVEFTGQGNAHTSSDPVDYLGSIINKAFGNDFEKFDEWWAVNKDKIPTAPDVKVNVSIAVNPDKSGTIVYSRQRPLVYSDFKGEIENNPSEAAATVSGIGVAYQTETRNSQLVVNINIFPNFNTAKSWFRKTEQEARVLAHEQTHFEITALYACKLAKTLRTTRFTKENYSRYIEELQKQNSAAAIQEEDIYDNETIHGTIPDKQEEWQIKIKEEIKNCGCY